MHNEEIPPEEEKWICPACEAEIPAGSPICPKCGQEFDLSGEVGICPKCEAEVVIGSAACPNCGQEFATEEDSETEAMDEDATNGLVADYGDEEYLNEEYVDDDAVADDGVQDFEEVENAETAVEFPEPVEELVQIGDEEEPTDAYLSENLEKPSDEYLSDDIDEPSVAYLSENLDEPTDAYPSDDVEGPTDEPQLEPGDSGTQEQDVEGSIEKKDDSLEEEVDHAEGETDPTEEVIMTSVTMEPEEASLVAAVVHNLSESDDQKLDDDYISIDGDDERAFVDSEEFLDDDDVAQAPIDEDDERAFVDSEDEQLLKTIDGYEPIADYEPTEERQESITTHTVGGDDNITEEIIVTETIIEEEIPQPQMEQTSAPEVLYEKFPVLNSLVRFEAPIVLILYLAALGFVMVFNFLGGSWHDNFRLYNTYLTLVAGLGLTLAFVLVLVTRPEISSGDVGSDIRKMLGILGVVVLLTAMLLLLIFGARLGEFILLLNILVVFGSLALIQLSRALSWSEVKRLAICLTGITLVLLVPVHEAFGPFKTDFTTIPWHAGNEAMIVGGLILAAAGFSTLRTKAAFLTLWLFGLMVLFLIPFHEAASILASGSYEPWDHTFAITGLVTASAGTAGFLVRRNKLGGLTKHLHAGNELFKLEDYKGALIHYDRAMDMAVSTESSMKNHVPWLAKADAYVMLGKLDQALAMYDMAVSINPRDEMLLVNRANCLAQLKRKNEALESIQKALFIKENNPEVWLSKATIEMEMGRLEDANESYQRILNQYPEHERAVLGRSRILRLLHRYPEALDLLEKSITLNPDNTAFLLDRVRVMYSAGMRDEARQILDSVLKREPKNSLAIREKSKMLMDLDQHVEAEELLQFLSIGEDDIELRLLKARNASLMGDDQRATGILEGSLAKYGEHKDVLFMLSRIQGSASRTEEGVDTLRKAVSISKPMLDNAQLAGALERFADYIKDDPTVLDARKGKMETHMKLEDYHGALQMWPGIESVNGHDPMMFNLAGEAYLKTTDLPKALEAFEQSIALDPENLTALFKKANILAKQNRLDEAIELFNQVLSKNPNYPPALTNRTRCINSRLEQGRRRNL